MFILLKFILIFFLIFYLISKVGGFLIRLFFGKLANQQRHNPFQDTSRKNYKKPAGGNVNIEYMPGDSNSNHSKDFKGGDYVEYEEIK